MIALTLKLAVSILWAFLVLVMVISVPGLARSVVEAGWSPLQFWLMVVLISGAPVVTAMMIGRTKA